MIEETIGTIFVGNDIKQMCGYLDKVVEPVETITVIRGLNQVMQTFWFIGFVTGILTAGCGYLVLIIAKVI